MTDGPWELPDGWRWATVEAVSEKIETGFAFAKKRAVSEGLLHLRPYNLSATEGLDLSERLYIPRNRDTKEVPTPQPGDVLFNNTNSVELVGKAAYIDEELDAAYSNHVTLVRSNKDMCLGKWLALCLRALWQRGYFEHRCNRWIGQAGYNTSELKQTPVALPTLSQQRGIVAKIKSVFERTREAKSLRKSLEEDVNTLMDSALADTFPNPAAALPQGWEMYNIGDMSAKPQYGYTQSAAEQNVGPKFLRITDIQDGRVDWDAVPYCECSESDLEKYRVKPGDLLFARSGATTGKSFLVRDCPKAVFASYLIRLQIEDGASPEFVYWFFQSPYYWRQIQPRGAAQPNVNATVLSKLKVPVPYSPQQQKKIVEHLKQIDGKVRELTSAQETAQAELFELEQSVLDRAFRGEL